MSPFPTAMHQLALTQSMPVALGTGVVVVGVGVAALVAVRVVPFHWFPKIEFVPATLAVPRTSHVVGGHARDRREGRRSCSRSGRGGDERPRRAVPRLGDGWPGTGPPHGEAKGGPHAGHGVERVPGGRRRVHARHHRPRRAVPLLDEGPTARTGVLRPTATQKVDVVQDTSERGSSPTPLPRWRSSNSWRHGGRAGDRARRRGPAKRPAAPRRAPSACRPQQQGTSGT